MSRFIKLGGFFLIYYLAIGGQATAQVTHPMIPATRYDVTQYGASASSSDNTIAFQKAIDACTASGGGIVNVPAGTFLCGPIIMKDRVNLCISKGAVLKMLPYGKGNGADPGSYPNIGVSDHYTHFIYGRGVHDIMISGNGTIDGQGADWWKVVRAKEIAIKRGCIIRLDECKNIEIKEITLRNSPNVHITIGRKSSNVIISHVTIEAPNDSPNTDGIDTWAPNVNISDCNISCGDDNVAMDAASANVIIKRCKFGYGHGCSIGSFTTGVNHILVDSCTFTNTTAGIRLKSNRERGGDEHDIVYSNIEMDGVKNPIYISSYYPKTPKQPTDDAASSVTDKTPSWKHILIKNVTVRNSENALLIWGLPEQHVSDVILDNVKVSARKGIVINYADGIVFKNHSAFTVTQGDYIQQYESKVSGL
jgi:polygalacturonase